MREKRGDSEEWTEELVNKFLFNVHSQPTFTERKQKGDKEAFAQSEKEAEALAQKITDFLNSEQKKS
jgi:hypothetical protein